MKLQVKLPSIGKKKEVQIVEQKEEKAPSIEIPIKADLLDIPIEEDVKELLPDVVKEELEEGEEWVEETHDATFQKAELLESFEPQRKKRKKPKKKTEIEEKLEKSHNRPSIFQLIILGGMGIFLFINAWVFFALAIIMILTLLYPLVYKLNALVKVIKKKHDREKIRKVLVVDTMQADKILTIGEFLFNYGFVKKLETKIKDMVKRGIYESGIMEDSSKIARYSIVTTFFGFIASIPIGITLAINVHIALLIVVMFPLLLLMMGIIKLKMTKQERKALIEHELPIFIACVTIMEEVRINLYKFMEKIAETNSTLFPMIKKEIRLFQRNKTFIGMDNITALSKVSSTHPSATFRAFVSDYHAAITTSATNAKHMMESATEKALYDMETRSTDYTKQAASISQAILLIMAMFPLMGLMMTFIASGKDSVSLIVVGIVLLPVMTMMILMMVDAKQPKTNAPVPVKYTWIIAGIVTMIVLLLAGLELWVILGVSVGIAALVNMIDTKKFFANITNVDERMPAFLEYVKDSRVEGISISKAVNKQAYREEPGSFHDTLIYLNAKLHTGGNLSEAVENSPTRSWLAKIVFFVLGQVHESGGGSPDTLRIFSQMIKKIELAQREMLKSLKGSLMLGYMIPMIMAMMLAAADQMTAGLGDDLGGLEGLNISFPTPEVAEQTKQQSNFLVVECCVLIGVIVSKIAYFTLKHSQHTMTLSFLGVILVAAVPHLTIFG